MRKTTLDLDEVLLMQAQAILGTKGIKDTIDTALREVIVREARRREVRRLKELDIDPDELRRHVWGP